MASSVSHIPRATIDFETRSTLTPRTNGASRYASDPTTEILCLAFRLPYWRKGRTGLYHPAFPHLDIPEEDRELGELFLWVHDNKPVEAHNAWFERCVWRHKRLPHWPEIRSHQWMCSAAKAATHSLPRGLEDAISALKLPVHKDVEGEKLMKTLIKPRKPLKRDRRDWRRQHCPCRECEGLGKLDKYKRDGTPTKHGERCWKCGGSGHSKLKPPPIPLLWRESKEEFERLFEYNRADVLAEEALSEALPDLNPFEQQVFWLDQEMNERGFSLDMDAVDAALVLIDVELADLNAELADLTRGEVVKATQRAKILDWLGENGLNLDDTRKETLDSTLEQGEELPPWVLSETADAGVFRVLEIVRTAGRSSTAKYTAMQNWADADGRVRGGLLYHGAGTGRWTGKGVQPHNFPKGGL